MASKVWHTRVTVKEEQDSLTQPGTNMVKGALEAMTQFGI